MAREEKQKKPRRTFGSVRKLPSGKFQASYIGRNGIRQPAPAPFKSERDADRWLLKVEADLSSGAWQDEELGKVPFRQYADAYLTENEEIGERWEETCRRNMRLHMVDLLDLPLRSITPPVVRKWYSKARRGTGGRTSIAQSYRFLRAVMNAAVRDEAIVKNPCQIPGAGADKASERPIATPDQVGQLIDAITPRYRAAVAVAAWCTLRRGEVCALRTADIDTEHKEVWVRKNWVELLESSRKFEKDPKTQAGKREVSVPPHVWPLLTAHAKEFAGPEFFFIGRDGQRMRGNAIYQAFVRARKKVGLTLTFHDLRHTGQSLAAASGASTVDLMKRAGHSTAVAAQRYIHAVDGRDREVAKALSEIAEKGSAARLPRTIKID
ncbi:site-specific integrase [Kribbella speibonae]|uniref:Site-specific integrase n=1 Tax=Kribbella speibonae TaxID=1572660 RepID=A0ABY2A022_9ACTN|nr:site-specific integrase [Kribbella speibonae]TCC19431.1 site-specific integrase [Kribbella speibonae]